MSTVSLVSLSCLQMLGLPHPNNVFFLRGGPTVEKAFQRTTPWERGATIPIDP